MAIPQAASDTATAPGGSMRGGRHLRLAVVAGDCAAVTTALALGLRPAAISGPAMLALAVAVTAALDVALGLQRVRRLGVAEELRRLLLVATLSVWTVVLVAWDPAAVPRSRLAGVWLLAAVTLLAVRLAWRWWVARGWAAGRHRLRTVVVGDGATSAAGIPTPGDLEVVGLVTASPAPRPGALGTLDDLRGIVREHAVECVLVAGHVGPDGAAQVLRARRLDGVEVRVGTAFPDLSTAPAGGPQAVSLGRRPTGMAQAFTKRAFDVVTASLGLLLVAPLLTALAIAIKRGSRGPVLYRQERIGLRGRPFTLLKLRTMVDGADRMLDALLPRYDVDERLYKLHDDPRVTPLGAWLRRLALDELPQLWNVLRGEMSLVGPRPALDTEVAHYERWHLDRLEVRPGITGLWQVRDQGKFSFDQCVGLDLYYVDHWSLLLELRIVLETVPALLRRRGVW